MEYSRAEWRLLVVGAVVLCSCAWVLAQPPIVQDQTYHAFADRRMFFGVPNFFDVASNLAFLVVGIIGLAMCRRTPPAGGAWVVLFFGVSLVSVGSAYYHWAPSDRTLVWDRLPMTIGFMGLLAALLGEHLGERWGALSLVPLLLLGIASVAWWRVSGDLRFYFWVQFVPLLLIPIVLVLYRPTYSNRWLLLVALGFYALAKFAEAGDEKIFVITGGSISGHTIKHLLSALGCLALALMLWRRRRITT